MSYFPGIILEFQTLNKINETTKPLDIKKCGKWEVMVLLKCDIRRANEENKLFSDKWNSHRGTIASMKQNLQQRIEVLQLFAIKSCASIIFGIRVMKVIGPQTLILLSYSQNRSPKLLSNF